MQNICFYFNFYKANIIPKVILTGSPGGTVIVIKSKNFLIISAAYTISWSLMIKKQYDKIDRLKRKNKNLVDYLWN
jgi:hypothetical protein